MRGKKINGFSQRKFKNKLKSGFFIVTYIYTPVGLRHQGNDYYLTLFFAKYFFLIYALTLFKYEIKLRERNLHPEEDIEKRAEISRDLLSSE